MNIFNFNKTVYRKNCGMAFYKFCLKKHFSIIKYAIIQLWALGMYLLGFWSEVKYREKFFCFLKGLKDIDALIEEFWIKEETNINHDLIKNRTEDDVIITREPEFLVSPIAKKLNMQLIATEVEKSSGKHLSQLCNNEEMVSRLESLGINSCENVYTNSTNTSLLNLAKNQYIVDKDNITEVSKYQPSFMAKLKSNFFTVEFFQFLVLGVINTVNSTIIATLFSLVIQANIAFICGYIISLCIAYVLNSIWIFKQKINLKKLIMFAVSYIPNFMIQNVIVLLLFNLAGLNKILVYALAAIIGIPVTFICVKLLCFFKKKKD